MRQAVVVLVFAAGCAEILGIDDGKPRTYDGGSDATLDASTDASDASKDVVVIDTFSPLHCGSSTCDFGKGESCCWSNDGGFACVGSASQCTSGVDIPCDRAEQCSQDAGPAVCCAAYASTDAGAVATSVACTAKANCASGHFIVCEDDSSADCPADASCGPSAISLPTYLICKP